MMRYTRFTPPSSHPDRPLQKAALSCLLTYKSRHLALYEEKFQTLLDDTRWRDELTILDFVLIQPQGRGVVVDVLTQLLFGLMLERKGRSQGADRRAAVLGALGGCTEGELGLLVDLMLRPLGSSCTARRDLTFFLAAGDAGVSDKQQTGFFTLRGEFGSEDLPVLAGTFRDYDQFDCGYERTVSPK